MRTLEHLFADHPHAVGETYLEHLASACGFGARLILAGLACLLHGIFPFLFQTTGSKAVRELHTRMVTHRVRTAPKHPGDFFGAGI
jgi:hypothetical protein